MNIRPKNVIYPYGTNILINHIRIEILILSCMHLSPINKEEWKKSKDDRKYAHDWKKENGKRDRYKWNVVEACREILL